MAGDTNYNAASGTGTLTVTKVTPAISVAGATISYSTASTTLSATLSYPGAAPTSPVMFSVDSGAPVFAICTAATGSESCTATYPAPALTATTHTITASVAADTNYNAASGTGTLTVTSIAPTIGFAVPGHTYGDAPFSVTVFPEIVAAPDTTR